MKLRLKWLGFVSKEDVIFSEINQSQDVACSAELALVGEWGNCSLAHARAELCSTYKPQLRALDPAPALFLDI